MKKTISIILCLTIFVSCFFSVSSQALTIDYNNYTAMQIISKFSEVAEHITKGLKNYESSISVKEYKIEQELVDEIYKSILVENPEIFYVNPYNLKCSVSASTGMIVDIMPVYLFSENEMPKRIKEFEAEAQKYIKGVKDSWPEYKKCRYLHDLIISNCEYDVDYSTDDVASRSAWGVFFNKKAVCQGYALAYNYLLGRIGIESHFVESYTVNHAWSMVKLNNKYYHVDVTWDDPTSDLSGRILHSYFLISDNRLSKLEPIRKWVSNMKATDTSYDNAWWSDVRSFIYTVDNKDYYIDSNYTEDEYAALMCYDSNGNHKCIYKIKERWYENGEKRNYWQGGHSCLAYDGKLFYFNTPTAVYSIKADGSGKTKCYTNPSKEWKPIYGLVLSIDGKFRVEIQKTPMSKNGVISVFTPAPQNDDNGDTNSGNNSGAENNSTSTNIGSSSSNVAGSDKVVNTQKTKLKLKTPKIKITVSKKKIKVKYTKVSGAVGFQIKYKFGKKAVTKTYSTKKTVTKTINKLKKGTYKVYVRAYAKQGKTKVYSSWTKAKTVKVK